MVIVKEGTSLVVQWVRLQAPNIGGLGSIPGQETRSYMYMWVRVCNKDPEKAITKTQHSQNKYMNIKKNLNPK